MNNIEYAIGIVLILGLSALLYFAVKAHRFTHRFYGEQLARLEKANNNILRESTHESVRWHKEKAALEDRIRSEAVSHAMFRACVAKVLGVEPNGILGAIEALKGAASREMVFWVRMDAFMNRGCVTFGHGPSPLHHTKEAVMAIGRLTNPRSMRGTVSGSASAAPHSEAGI